MTMLSGLWTGRADSSGRRAAVAVGAVVATAAALEALLPGPLHGGVVARGVLAGCVNALLATGLIVVWRSARIVNFAQAAMGAAASYLCYALVQFIHVPFLIALPVAVVGGAVTGALIDAVFIQRFFTAPRLVLTVVTIVVARFLGDSRTYVNWIPGLGSAAKRPENAPAQGEVGLSRIPFSNWKVHIFPYEFGFAAAATLVLTAAALMGLAIWLRRSRLGTAVRGVASNAERAQSLGINVRLVGSVAWMLAGTLSGVAILLSGMNTGFEQVGTYSPELLIPALAAAVLSRMSSIPIAVLAAIVIGVVDAAVKWSNPSSTVVPVALLVVMAAALLLQRRQATRSEDSGGMSWDATKEIRPVPKELAKVPEVVRARRGLIAAAVVAAATVPFIFPPSQTNVASLIFIQGLVGLSLIVLTGWAGQISLGQFALVAVAAVLGSNLTSVHHVPFWLAVPLCASVTGAFAVVLGVSALRLRGPFLAVMTLAFAVAVDGTLFHTQFFLKFIPNHVERPHVLFVSFASERSYYFLCLFTLIVAAVIVAGMRRSRTGRVLIAARDNDSGVESFGVPVVKVRLAAFAVSGALCGTAGILFAHHQRAIDPGSYAASVSVEMFIMTMIGGIGSMAGALLGAAYVGIATFIIPSPFVRNLTTSGGLLVLLFMAPGGLASLSAAARDAGLRIVAMRRNIAVPSLFADVDAEALLQQRAPLVARIPFRGLEVIPPHRRYARTSELHGRRRPSKEHVTT
jgi:branched-chain amino acid transport system permease protein